MGIVNNLTDGVYAPLNHKHELSDINGVTASATEINYLSGVTSNIQEQIDSIERVNNRITVVLKSIPGASFTISNSKESYSGTIGDTGTGALYVYYLDTYTINVTLVSSSKTTTYKVNYIGTHNVTVYPVSTFATDDYAAISAASKAGVLASTYAIGDTKDVTLNGSVGNGLTFSNTKVYMQILAFDHNIDVEMNGEHHMICGFGKMTSSGADTCFVDSIYSNTSTSQYLNMNLSNTNSGGWASSKMRSVICPAFKNALPSALRSILRSRTIYTDNTGNGNNNSSSAVTATTDTVYIPSEFEVQGIRSYANSYEQSYQKQLAYYNSGNSKIRFRHDSTTTTALWWCRSASYGGSNSFCSVLAAGSAGNDGAHYSRGFVPLITL